ncbi:hypothetical protein KSGM81_04495 [Klebsiella quasipneumoniae]|uniref:hypothetical protein n=1 Tax=Klebsiella pneumoniae complex TaxID=3390273 RepID=UPI000D7456E2|nr:MULTISPECIES: hypothetical protein [Klebsiella]HBR1015643.1 hypothetical protein [Klebsiella quasipneumoniae subsp. similipneumoniae]HBW7922064.1 hypothetical protein [Klebsiella pneumoniae]HCB1270077.1 hypothetical protein [Klebsiella quasipneumoniae subsp. quasipneumoniae]PXJ92786.1 hypothetical protein DMR35_26015 [Klebsiella variicola]SNQ41531.1 hypothetical protein KSGM81_04495 [Klebsiella quasipneumoniae]
MLICISDCIYFDMGLRYAIIQNNYCGNEINKIVSYTNNVRISDFPKYFHSTKNLGHHLSYILIDYSQSHFEVLQSVLLLKIFYPLTKVFVCIKDSTVFTEFEKALIFIINADIVHNFSDFCDLIKISKKRNTNSPCDILFKAMPSNFHVSRKDILFISLIIAGLSPDQISSVLDINLKKVYYYRNKIHAKLIIKNDIELICRIKIFTVKFYNKVLKDEILSLR